MILARVKIKPRQYDGAFPSMLQSHVSERTPRTRARSTRNIHSVDESGTLLNLGKDSKQRVFNFQAVASQ